MKTSTEASREMPVLCETDGVVIGGGAAGIGAALGAGPVSYTQLDVYKRQGTTRPGSNQRDERKTKNKLAGQMAKRRLSGGNANGRQLGYCEPDQHRYSHTFSCGRPYVWRQRGAADALFGFYPVP